ncbi:MAG TPA: DNA replication/repair protein RecF [Ktedonobacterales bacterium]|jgi:DNA replication and repair protein RecF
MHVERLRLTDFRNYAALDLSLRPGLVVFRGRNAQGKSNVLEAVSILATSRSFRTATERETVRWGAPGHFARVDGLVARRADTAHVEVVIADATVGEGQPAAPGGAPASVASATSAPAPFRKRIRVNGTPRRAMDLIGQVTVVVFTPRELDLVAGEPSQRRRFLDLTLCQVKPAYCRALSQYQKVITQRAALLRRIRDGEESPHALAYWDGEMARLAAPVMRERAAFLARAEVAAARVYATLARDETDGEADDGAGAMPTAPMLRVAYRPSYKGALEGDDGEIARGVLAQLAELRRREIAQGVNVLGPHRDDVAFLAETPAGPVDLAVYGSRGQQRSVALALKLAELEYIETATGDQPILLLDDVLSELDAQRRADLLLAVHGVEQVLLTTADTEQLPADALAAAQVFEVRAGRVMEAE